MNDKGIFFSGNRKLSSVTGEEEIFSTPIRTVTGEDISERVGINITVSYTHLTLPTKRIV